MYADQALPRPDIVFQLDIEIEKIVGRENYGDEIYEKEELQKKIRKEFEIFHKHKYWKIVDASQEKEEIYKSLVNHIDKLYKDYAINESDEFKRNFYPYSIAEDLFMYKDI